MDFAVVWTMPAADQLQEVIEYVQRENPAAAQRMADDIAHRIDLLGKFPLSGGIYLRTQRREIREILAGKYRIFYRVRRRLKRVEILAVWHGARKEPKFRRL